MKNEFGIRLIDIGLEHVAVAAACVVKPHPRQDICWIAFIKSLENHQTCVFQIVEAPWQEFSDVFNNNNGKSSKCVFNICWSPLAGDDFLTLNRNIGNYQKYLFSICWRP